jgi:hypothetical protein
LVVGNCVCLLVVGNGVGLLVVVDNGVGLIVVVVGNGVGLNVGGSGVGLLVGNCVGLPDVGSGVGDDVRIGADVGDHGPKLIRTNALAGMVVVSMETTSTVNALVVPSKFGIVTTAAALNFVSKFDAAYPLPGLRVVTKT